MDQFRQIEFKRIAKTIILESNCTCKNKELLTSLIQQALIDVSMQRLDESGKIIASIKKEKP